jgi:hypothetical protein
VISRGANARLLEEETVVAEAPNHLRGLGPHVCGCWAVSPVLGKP